jgi:pSer/pThr/pTyr-binding forkhead associated (FHA) protein
MDRALVVVGRHPHCDARLDSPRVSRWHCCLTEVNGAVWVRDLGSANGTWINGRRVEWEQLRPGDVLAIAHIRYRLDEDQPTWARPSDPRASSRGGWESRADLQNTGLPNAS